MKGSLVLVTWIFGGDRWSKSWMPSFLRGVGGCGVDVLFVGEPAPPRDVRLPPNARFERLSWEAAKETVRATFRSPLPSLERAGFQKTSDFRFLTPVIVASVSKYAWWGIIDNDMWLSHKFKALEEELIRGRYDFVRIARPHNEELDNEMSARGDHGRRPSRLTTRMSMGPFLLCRTEAYFSWVLPVLKGSRAALGAFASEKLSFFDESFGWPMYSGSIRF